MPSDSYRLYQVERAKSPAEIQRADEQAARLVSAVSWLFRAIARPVRPARAPRWGYPAEHGGAACPAEPAACRRMMAGTMEGC